MYYNMNKNKQLYFMHELPSVARNSTTHMHVSLDCCNKDVMRLDHWSTSPLHSDMRHLLTHRSAQSITNDAIT